MTMDPVTGAGPVTLRMVSGAPRAFGYRASYF